MAKNTLDKKKRTSKKVWILKGRGKLPIYMFSGTLDIGRFLEEQTSWKQ